MNLAGAKTAASCNQLVNSDWCIPRVQQPPASRQAPSNRP